MTDRTLQSLPSWCGFLCAATILAAGCRTVPITGRHQLMLSTQATENRLGNQTYELYRKRFAPSSHTDYQEALKRVGTALANVLPPQQATWDVILLESAQANAVFLPQGHVIVFRGFMDRMENDAELAAILAHELAHGLARHAGESRSWEKLDGWTGQKPNAPLPNIGRTRTFEFEADAIGLMLMARAGYDPMAAISFWSRIEKDRATPVSEFLAPQHPPVSLRIRHLRRQLPEAGKAYLQAPQKRGRGQRLRNQATTPN